MEDSLKFDDSLKFEYSAEFLKMMGSLKTENLKYDDDGKFACQRASPTNIYLYLAKYKKIIFSISGR